MTAAAQSTGAAFERLVEVIALLREHCPWMGELTHESLAEYLVEECYELLEVIEGPEDAAELRAELGDVLLQVVLHARLQEERGSFRIADVVEGLTAKMIRRNAHIFTPDGVLRNVFPASVEEIETAWHRIKRQEQPVESTPFASIPAGLPALASAAKTLKRARRDGGSAPEPGIAVVVPPEVPTEETALASEDELGEVLLAVVGRAVTAGLDPERALRVAVRRYQENHLARGNSDVAGGPRLRRPTVTDGH